jgi:glucose/mannose-6-phosphate isomerase
LKRVWLWSKKLLKMIDLDKIEQVEKTDSGNIVNSILALPAQIEQVWKQVREVEKPDRCALAKNVVIAGMGGSALGGRMIDSLIQDRSRTPIEVFTQFHIPNYVNQDSLVIISSYSGNTEETLSDLNQAIKRKAQVFAITTGGRLSEFIKDKTVDGIIIDPINNPSGQPRMALGYSVASILAILSRCEFIQLSTDEIDKVVNSLKIKLEEFGITVNSQNNLAKLVSKKLYRKIPVLVASEHMVGSAHAFKNQINETAKCFSVLFDIPELNHHLMEGLKNPAEAKQYLKFLFIESELYSDGVKKRYPITQEVVGKNEVEFFSYKLTSEKKIEQIFELLALSSFVSFYLSCLYGEDPVKIPWVDYFKSKLSP